jgi:predicted ribosome quality control (RQC) complex YloA/Tae2 family protein
VPGIEDLDRTIERFEKAQKALREETRKAHETIQALMEQRKLLDNLIKETMSSIESQMEDHVVKQLKDLGEQADKASSHIYDKVGHQIDILIDLSLGKHLSRRRNVEDIRPKLAEHLKEWLREELEKHTDEADT